MVCYVGNRAMWTFSSRTEIGPSSVATGVQYWSAVSSTNSKTPRAQNETFGPRQRFLASHADCASYEKTLKKHAPRVNVNLSTLWPASLNTKETGFRKLPRGTLAFRRPQTANSRASRQWLQGCDQFPYVQMAPLHVGHFRQAALKADTQKRQSPPCTVIALLSLKLSGAKELRREIQNCGKHMHIHTRTHSRPTRGVKKNWFTRSWKQMQPHICTKQYLQHNMHWICLSRSPLRRFKKKAVTAPKTIETQEWNQKKMSSNKNMQQISDGQKQSGWYRAEGTKIIPGKTTTAQSTIFRPTGGHATDLCTAKWRRRKKECIVASVILRFTCWTAEAAALATQ